MLSTIPTGQFVGSTIEHVFFLFAGAYLLLLWPKRVKGQVASGKISQDAADAEALCHSSANRCNRHFNTRNLKCYH